MRPNKKPKHIPWPTSSSKPLPKKKPEHQVFPSNPTRQPGSSKPAPKDPLPRAVPKELTPWEVHQRGRDSRQEKAITETPACVNVQNKGGENTKQHQAWRESYPELIFQTLVYRGCLINKAVDVTPQEKLRTEYENMVRGQIPHCRLCQSDEPGCLEFTRENSVFYCTLKGAVLVDAPAFRCRACKGEMSLHPVQIGCFPSTPTVPTVFYKEEVMAATCFVQMAAPYAMNAWATVLQRLHKFHGFDTPSQIFEHVGTAGHHWAVVEDMLDDPHTMGVMPIVTGGCLACPCCYRKCQAMSADACLAFRRFRRAASASMGIQALGGSQFVPDDEVQAALSQRKETMERDDARDSCEAKFKAAQLVGKRLKNYDYTGVAAFVCRHEYVVLAANMTTEENFTYYDVLLKKILEAYCSANGRELNPVVFIDVGCKYGPHFGKARATMDASGLYGAPDIQFAVGPWHLQAHQMKCHVLYNPRYLKSAALTYGDAPEHLWADLRKYSVAGLYMSPAKRQEHLSMLIKAREKAKELRLMKQLRKWYIRANAEILSCSERLEQLGITAAMEHTSPRDRALTLLMEQEQSRDRSRDVNPPLAPATVQFQKAKQKLRELIGLYHHLSYSAARHRRSATFRSESTRLVKAKAKVKMQIGKTLQTLQTTYPEHGWPTVEQALSTGEGAWDDGSPPLVYHVREVEDVRERQARASEELSVLEREASDACKYYAYYHAAVAQKLLEVDHLLLERPLAVIPAGSQYLTYHVEVQRTLVSWYLRGMRAQLQTKHHFYERQQEESQQLIDWMQRGGVEGQATQDGEDTVEEDIVEDMLEVEIDLVAEIAEDIASA